MKLPVKPMLRLELAPKLQRPLSLWNPLDYGRLLYWIFYFPQAFRWYADTLGTGYIPRGEDGFKRNLRKGITLLRTDPVQRTLWFQGLLMMLVLSLSMYALLANIELTIDWWIPSSFVALSFVGTILFGLVGTIGESLILGIGFIFVGTAMSLIFRDDSGLIFRVVAGLLAGIVFSAIENVPGGIIGFWPVTSCYILWHFMMPVIMLAPVALIGGCIYLVQLLSGDFSLLEFLEGLGWLFRSAFTMGWMVAIATSIASLRPDTWFMGTLTQYNHSFLFPRNTALPLPWLTTKLRQRLRADWDEGLAQCQEILAHSSQFIAVVKAVNAELAQSDESHLLWRVSRLADHATDWRWVGLVSVSLKRHILTTAKLYFQMVFLFWKFDKETTQKLSTQPITEPMRLDTLPRAAAAGFWYLHEKEPAQAAQAFNQVRHILYGEELYAIAHCLNLCQVVTSFEQLRATQFSAWPDVDPEQSLHPTTWDAIATLDYVTQEARLNQPTVSENTRAQAIARAQLALHQLLERADQIPAAERGLIVEIATTWQQWFDTAARELQIMLSYH